MKRENSLFPTEEHARVRIRDGKWLVIALNPRDGDYLLDPDTGERSPVAGSPQTEKIGPLLRDGAILVLGAGEVYRLDPETGDREPVSVVGPRPASISSLYPPWGDVIDAQGSVMVFGDERNYPARFDPDDLTLRLGPPNSLDLGCVLATFDDGSAIGIRDGNRLVLVHFDGRESEVLFPHPGTPEEEQQ